MQIKCNFTICNLIKNKYKYNKYNSINYIYIYTLKATKVRNGHILKEN